MGLSTFHKNMEVLLLDVKAFEPKGCVRSGNKVGWVRDIPAIKDGMIPDGYLVS